MRKSLLNVRFNELGIVYMSTDIEHIFQEMFIIVLDSAFDLIRRVSGRVLTATDSARTADKRHFF